MAAKIALLVAYDGTDFHGFARQPSRRTVQGVLEESLSQLLRSPVRTTGAGRTDAGVHAAGQVVSFEAPDGTDPAWVAARLNKRLGPEVSIRAAAATPDSFDARFSAKRREYEYHVYRTTAPDPFLDRFAVHVPGELDLAAMRSAAKAFVGERDFSSFCRRGEGSLVRRVRSIAFSAPAPGRLVIKVVADSFCHQMVRSLVGLLLEIGAGKRAPGDARRALAARDRGAAGPVAPAKGLVLRSVAYPRAPWGRSG
ncbi:MAG: tRNA pseudouridine(38-40) synthase TruA [Actinomycetota bacterium]